MKTGDIGSGTRLRWFRRNQLLLWLLLITLWAYFGSLVPSRWSHSMDKNKFLGFGNKPNKRDFETETNLRRDPIATDIPFAVKNGTTENGAEDGTMMDVVLAKNEKEVSSHQWENSENKTKRAGLGLHSTFRGEHKKKLEVEGLEMEKQKPDILNKSSTNRLLVGPFGLLENRLFEWNPKKRPGTCDRSEDFARLAWARRFVLIFHELTMTEAPLSMMELASELLSCGATVYSVTLSKKGELMPELSRRRIKVLQDKGAFSFRTALKADLVIAGSALCAPWIDEYVDLLPAGASRVAWWIMESQRDYFDQAKFVLNRVKMLVFLSESQSKLWLKWCKKENIKLRTQHTIVPLSISDELTWVAGIAGTFNGPTFSTGKMIKKKQLLRDSVRKEMGLTDNDMLVMSLSTITPGHGQLLLLESANLIIEKESLQYNSQIQNPVDIGQVHSVLARRHHSRALNQMLNGSVSSIFSHRQKLLGTAGIQKQFIKVLIGSVGSNRNEVLYIKELLRYVSHHPILQKSVLWTPATIRVAALYAAADAYVTNSQGFGETFGRATIEAMAFGLPVLGTDAGGTKEIVEHNITGLLHPLGRTGVAVLSENLRFLLKNPLVRKEMGLKGREKVERMYLKRHMHNKFVHILLNCMRRRRSHISSTASEF